MMTMIVVMKLVAFVAVAGGLHWMWRDYLRLTHGLPRRRPARQLLDARVYERAMREAQPAPVRVQLPVARVVSR